MIGVEAIPYIWLGLAVVGLGMAALSLVDSVRDYLVTRPTNGFRALSLGDIAQESVRVVLYLLFAGVGIVFLAQGLTPSRAGVGWMMIAAEALIVLKTAIQIYVRRYLKVRHRVIGLPETQDQREDREFGEVRRELEKEHMRDG